MPTPSCCASSTRSYMKGEKRTTTRARHSTAATGEKKKETNGGRAGTRLNFETGLDEPMKLQAINETSAAAMYIGGT